MVAALLACISAALVAAAANGPAADASREMAAPGLEAVETVESVRPGPEPCGAAAPLAACGCDDAELGRATALAGAVPAAIGPAVVPGVAPGAAPGAAAAAAAAGLVAVVAALGAAAVGAPAVGAAAAAAGAADAAEGAEGAAAGAAEGAAEGAGRGAVSVQWILKKRMSSRSSSVSLRSIRKLQSDSKEEMEQSQLDGRVRGAARLARGESGSNSSEPLRKRGQRCQRGQRERNERGTREKRTRRGSEGAAAGTRDTVGEIDAREVGAFELGRGGDFGELVALLPLNLRLVRATVLLVPPRGSSVTPMHR